MLLSAACGGDSSVDPIEVRNLTLEVEPSKLFLGTGQSERLFARLLDGTGATVSTNDLTWSSSDPLVASVDDHGMVTAVDTGNVVITATAEGRSKDSNVKVRGKGRLELYLASGSDQSGPVGQMLPLPLVVEVRDGTGTGVPEVEVDWKASGNDGSTSAPSTTTNQNGLTQVLWTLGPSVGTQTLQAQVKGAGTAGFSATAVAGEPARVVVSPATTSVPVGEIVQFGVLVYDEFQNSVEGAEIVWSSSASEVAQVDPTGLAEAMSPGSALIEAYAGPAHGNATLDVTGATPPGTVTDLAVRSTSSSGVTLGFTQVDDGTGAPADYEVHYGASPMSDRWDSATPATVGTCATPVQGSAIGEALVCSVDGLAASTTYDFEVVATRNSGTVTGDPSNVATGSTQADAPEVAGVIASEESHTFTALGQTLQLSASALDGSGAGVTGVDFSWTTTDASIATVDDTGLVLANAVGTASIIVKALCCAPADTVAVTVSQVPAAIEVSPASFSLGVDQNQQLTALVLDSAGAVIQGAPVAWSSTAPAIASVDATGLVTGLSTGSVAFEARLENPSPTATLVSLAQVSSTRSGAVNSGPFAIPTASSVADLVGVSTATVQSTDWTGQLFYDGFESGDRSHTENGVGWAVSGGNVNVRRRDQMKDGAAPSGGDYALEVFYKGPTDNINAEQRFNLGAEYGEIWVEYSLYIPSNYYHRDDPTGPDNNKFFAMWTSTYGDGTFSFILEYERQSDGESDLKRFMSESHHADGSNNWPTGTPGAPDFITRGGNALMIGQWNRVRIHWKSASAADVNDGRIEIWTNDVLANSLDWAFWAKGDRPASVSHGWLMGAANSGWNEDTYFYVDDFRVWRSDPGWR